MIFLKYIKINILSLFLIFATLSVFAIAPNDFSDYRKIPAKDCTGKNIEYFTGNVEKCAQRCRSISTCAVFNAVDGRNGCWLKEDCNLNQLKSYGNNVTSFVNKALQDNQQYTSRVGVDCSGNDIEYFRGNVSDCAERCRLLDNCIAFNAVDGRSGCWLKNTCNTNADKLVKHNDTVVLYLKKDKIDTDKYTKMTGVDCAGSDIEFFKGTNEQCVERCDSNSKCVAFNAVDGRLGCWIKHTCNTNADKLVKHNDTVVLYLKKDKINTDKYTEMTGVDCAGSDIEFFKGTNEQCIERCDSNSKCVAFNTVDGRLGCWIKHTCNTSADKLVKHNDTVVLYLKKQQVEVCNPGTDDKQCISKLGSDKAKCLSNGQCGLVECTSNDHCTNSAQPICSKDNTCISCSGNTPYYDTANQVCAQCLNANHCQRNKICRLRNGVRKCVRGGRPDAD